MSEQLPLNLDDLRNTVRHAVQEWAQQKGYTVARRVTIIDKSIILLDQVLEGDNKQIAHSEIKRIQKKLRLLLREEAERFDGELVDKHYLTPLARLDEKYGIKGRPDVEEQREKYEAYPALKKRADKKIKDEMDNIADRELAQLKNVMGKCCEEYGIESPVIETYLPAYAAGRDVAR